MESCGFLVRNITMIGISSKIFRFLVNCSLLLPTIKREWIVKESNTRFIISMSFTLIWKKQNRQGRWFTHIHRVWLIQRIDVYKRTVINLYIINDVLKTISQQMSFLVSKFSKDDANYKGTTWLFMYTTKDCIIKCDIWLFVKKQRDPSVYIMIWPVWLLISALPIHVLV